MKRLIEIIGSVVFIMALSLAVVSVTASALAHHTGQVKSVVPSSDTR